MSTQAKPAFRTLSTYNYRLWAGGAIASNIGTWLQRTAQDWIVLTDRILPSVLIFVMRQRAQLQKQKEQITNNLLSKP